MQLFALIHQLNSRSAFATCLAPASPLVARSAMAVQPPAGEPAETHRFTPVFSADVGFNILFEVHLTLP
jgi:hypothetical protein